MEGWISPAEVEPSEHDRPISPNSLAALEPWDERLLEPIIFILRPSGQRVRAAGKHRCLKADELIKRGALPPGYRLPYRTIFCPDPESESRLIIALEKARRRSAWSANDFLHERRVSDPAVRELENLVRACGFEITSEKKRENWRQIMAFSTLEKISKHPGLLESALVLIRGAWADCPGSTDAVTIEGAARFIYCHQGAKAFLLDRAIDRMAGNLNEVRKQKKSAEKTVSANAAACFCIGMREVYNLPVRRGGLSLKPEREWTLKPKP